MSTKTKKFIRYIGGCFLHGQGVAAYESGENVDLVVETVGGKRVRYTAEDFNGEKVTRTIPVMTLSKDQFEHKLGQWAEDLHQQDARIVQNAIDDMTPADAFTN